MVSHGRKMRIDPEFSAYLERGMLFHPIAI
jgi:hypothetical protein